MEGKLYICFDTCVLVDCAFARNAKSSPGLLDRIFEKMDAAGAKLVMPEVVLAELDLASGKREADVRDAFKGILDKIDDVAGKKLLDNRNKGDIDRSVKRRRDDILKSANESLAKVRSLAADGEKAVLLGFTDEDVHEAILISLAGRRPSSAKAGYGLVQGDCLIAACLRRFIDEHPGDKVAFVSSNTSDFATGGENAGYQLHPDLRDYLPGLMYFSDPISMMADVLPDRTKTDKAKTAKLSDVYKGIVSLPTVDTAWASEFAKAVRPSSEFLEMMRQMQESAQPFKSASVIADVLSKADIPSYGQYMASLMAAIDAMRRALDGAPRSFDSSAFANALEVGSESVDADDVSGDGTTVGDDEVLEDGAKDSDDKESGSECE